jgi:ribonuclease HII
MVKILGIDEAGRGPVIGPMVIAGVMIEKEDEKKLGAVKDSKLLTQKQRLALIGSIKNNSKYKILVIEPEVIDGAILSQELNLNWLEAHKQAEIINELNPDCAIIDCPSINEKAYKNYLSNLVKNKKIELIVEHKADVNYPVCSAASILAKVKREEEITELKKKYGDFGPGYPSHPKTIEFVKDNYDKYPEIFRKTWSTYKRLSKPEFDKTKQKVLFKTKDQKSLF